MARFLCKKLNPEIRKWRKNCVLTNLYRLGLAVNVKGAETYLGPYQTSVIML